MTEEAGEPALKSEMCMNMCLIAAYKAGLKRESAQKALHED